MLQAGALAFADCSGLHLWPANAIFRSDFRVSKAQARLKSTICICMKWSTISKVDIICIAHVSIAYFHCIDFRRSILTGYDNVLDSIAYTRWLSKTRVEVSQHTANSSWSSDWHVEHILEFCLLFLVLSLFWAPHVHLRTGFQFIA